MRSKITLLLSILSLVSQVHASDFPVKCVDQNNYYGLTIGYETYFPTYTGDKIELAYGKLGRAHSSQKYEVVEAVHLRASSQVILEIEDQASISDQFPQFLVLSQNYWTNEGKWVVGLSTILNCSL